MSMHTPVLSVDALSVSYVGGAEPVRVLRDIAFEIGSGQALGLVGESGSGKSTAAMAVLGLLEGGGRIDAGTVRFKGDSLYDMSAIERRALRGAVVSIVFQDPFTSLNPSLRVGDQIVEPLLLHRGMHAVEARAEVLRLLAEVGIADPRGAARSYPHQLSGGMKQRALIAIALACDPALLILDEPTTALDVTVEAQVLDLLENLRRTRALAILFISHNLGIVARLCDEICVLYAGEVVERGPTAQVLSSPRHPYTKGLLAAMPQFARRGARLSTIPGRLPDVRTATRGCVFAARCPFALELCKRETQVLVAQGHGRESRCWRSVELAKTPWPVTDGRSAPSLPPPELLATTARRAAAADERESGAPALIEVVDLERSFAEGGFLDNLSLDFAGPGAPLKYRPRLVRAVDQVSLRIETGEIVGLVGESGCGKSTLGRCLIDLIEPTGGTVRIDGEALSSVSATRRRALLGRAQIVFQNPDSSLNPRKTVRDIIARPLTLFGRARGAALETRIIELLEMVQLGAHYGDRFAHQLSGGEKQRVGIARALATEPAFIVCDEAVSALDVSVQAAILNLLADLRATLGVAYLFISHDLSVIAHIADRICVMFAGKIVEEGPVSGILHGPRHPYTDALLAAAPRLERARPTAPDERLAVANSAAAQLSDQRLGCPYARRCARKLGSECDMIAPPVRVAEGGHRIVCHIPLDALTITTPQY